MATKPQDPEATYTKAAKAELARDYDQAFKLYIKAAEDFLHQSRTATAANAKAHLKSRAGVALQRAEKIKAFRADSLTPVVRNPFSEQSQLTVLKKSSHVDGGYLELWSEPAAKEITITQPGLSPGQLSRGSVWKSSSELFPQGSMISSSLRPTDISQRIVSDCSVCASIAVCLDHNRRFGSKLGMSVLYPQDSEGVPSVSASNIHEVRFKFNGTFRRVCLHLLNIIGYTKHQTAIDDKLPASRETNELTCLSTGCTQVLWPSLIEKAYMKLMGGYDFPGSNSSTDLHTLIGWIPEHLVLSGPSFQREKTWTRMHKGFREGRCILTLGTADRNRIYWGNVHMLPAHCYAVTDLVENDDERFVTVLDSWLQGSPELGLGSRVLTMTWDEVCEVFEDAHLSWDPTFFKYTLSFHGLWKPKSASGDDGTGLHQHLRVKISPADPDDQSTSVWVLLTRHVTETRRTSDYIALRVEREFDRRIEQRIDQIAEKGTYINSSHVLVQATPQEIREGSLSLIASYDGDLEDVGFTLDVYSTAARVSWDESPNKLPFFHKVEGAFTSKTAGGNHTFSSYMSNPQYHLRIHPDISGTKVNSGRGERAKFKILGQIGKDVPFNVAVVWSDGSRVFDLVQSDIVCSSGTYGYGYAAAAGELLAGDYTIIASTFEPQDHLGPYTLRLESSRKFDVQPIPQEGAGMYSKIVKGSWQGDSAAGGPSSSRYLDNPKFDLEVPSTCQIKVRLQLLQPSPSVSLNVTIFPAPPSTSTPRKSFGRHISTSGPYTESVSGVVTPLVTYQAGNYLILPSTFEAGLENGFKIEVFSSVAGVKVQPSTR